MHSEYGMCTVFDRKSGDCEQIVLKTLWSLDLKNRAHSATPITSMFSSLIAPTPPNSKRRILNLMTLGAICGENLRSILLGSRMARRVILVRLIAAFGESGNWVSGGRGDPRKNRHMIYQLEEVAKMPNL